MNWICNSLTCGCISPHEKALPRLLMGSLLVLEKALPSSINTTITGFTIEHTTLFILYRGPIKVQKAGDILNIVKGAVCTEIHVFFLLNWRLNVIMPTFLVWCEYYSAWNSETNFVSEILIFVTSMWAFENSLFRNCLFLGMVFEIKYLNLVKLAKLFAQTLFWN